MNCLICKKELKCGKPIDECSRLRWREVKDCHQIIDDYAVYGTVTNKIQKSDFGEYDVYKWSARIMEWARVKGKLIEGYAKTIKEAKSIVFSLCLNTETFIHKDIKK